MTFADAIQSLTYGGSANAAKRPSWTGYVKVDITSTDATTGEPTAWTVTYRPKTGNTTYVYTYASGAWTAPATPLSMDAEFHAGMLANDWVTGIAADFEAARTGNGAW